MLHIDARYLFLIPLTLAEAFLLFVLWNFIKEGKRRH